MVICSKICSKATLSFPKYVYMNMHAWKRLMLFIARLSKLCNVRVRPNFWMSLSVGASHHCLCSRVRYSYLVDSLWNRTCARWRSVHAKAARFGHLSVSALRSFAVSRLAYRRNTPIDGRKGMFHRKHVFHHGGSSVFGTLTAPQPPQLPNRRFGSTSTSRNAHPLFTTISPERFACATVHIAVCFVSRVFMNIYELMFQRCVYRRARLELANGCRVVCTLVVFFYSSCTLI